MHTIERRKRTYKNRNSTFTKTEQIIYNSIAVDNSWVLREISDKICENKLHRILKSTVYRKLAKMQFTSKRLKLISMERNTLEKMIARVIYTTDVLKVWNDNLIF